MAGGGGTEYYSIVAIAENPNEENSIFLLLRNVDDDKNQLAKFNSQTETKTILANIASAAVWDLRYYSAKLFVLTRNLGDYYGHVKIYDTSGNLLENISIADLPTVISEGFNAGLAYRIAVVNENEILIIFGGTSRGLLMKKSGTTWDKVYSFAIGDWNNGGLLSIEVDRNGNFYCGGIKNAVYYVKTYKANSGLRISSIETENVISDIYLNS